SAATGQLTIAIASFVLMAAFGAWGAYLRWRDSKKFHEAIEKGDIQKAIEIRGK
ncbi:holin, partial [Salmonella enterica subsp. enterica serovar 4,12:i:-]|nr:holin [Salmonella enterica subsp. enterica serovar 4,12:i:-]